jgi:hypothetical protein
MSPQLRGTPSSWLSAFCNSFYPTDKDFNYLDGDIVLFAHAALPIAMARETRIIRILETKRDGEEIRPSQRQTLPILAEAIQRLVGTGDALPGSGVFIVIGDGPKYLCGAHVAKVRPAERLKDWSAIGVQYEANPVYFSREELIRFMRCRPPG